MVMVPFKAIYQARFQEGNLVQLGGVDFAGGLIKFDSFENAKGRAANRFTGLSLYKDLCRIRSCCQNIELSPIEMTEFIWEQKSETPGEW